MKERLFSIIALSSLYINLKKKSHEYVKNLKNEDTKVVVEGYHCSRLLSQPLHNHNIHIVYSKTWNSQ